MNEGTLLMIGMNRNPNDLESVITDSNEQNTGKNISLNLLRQVYQKHDVF